MPVWLDQLQPASFRGVRFQVDSIELTAGDNIVVREYPFQDLPTVFVMGQAVEEIRFSAYVIGSDYTEQRDLLREALDTGGDGVLIHPTAGSIRAIVSAKYSIKERPDVEGGMARFELTFVRGEERRYPVGRGDGVRQAQGAAEQAETAAQASFESTFSLAEQPGWVADRAVDRVGGGLDAMWRGLSDVMARINGLTQFVHLQIGRYQELRLNLDALVRSPARLAAAVAALFELPPDLGRGAARRYLPVLAGLFDLSRVLTRNDFVVSIVPPVGGGLVVYGAGNAVALASLDAAVANSAARRALTELGWASDRLIESLATAAYVRAAAVLVTDDEGDRSAAMRQIGQAVSGPHEAPLGYDEVMGARAAIHAQISRLLHTGSQAAPGPSVPAASWHLAMQSLHTAALSVLQMRDGSFARLSTYTPTAWMSVWNVSYLLYGTVLYADEIQAMNPHIVNPLLVPPGQPLRVVNHG